jgi:hypothetical protein
LPFLDRDGWFDRLAHRTDLSLAIRPLIDARLTLDVAVSVKDHGFERHSREEAVSDDVHNIPSEKRMREMNMGAGSYSRKNR